MADVNEYAYEDEDLEYYNEIHNSYECNHYTLDNGNVKFVCKCNRGTRYPEHSSSCKIKWTDGWF